MSEGGKNSPEEIHFFKRMLVIAYSLGVVAIGLKLFREEHGSFFGFLKKETAAIAGQVKDGDVVGGFLSNIQKGREKIRDPEAEKRGREASSLESEVKNVDKLTNRDREELDALLGGLDGGSNRP